MKKLLINSALLVCSVMSMQAQSIIGKWKTIDDKTQKPKSIVEITEKNGVYSGKVIEILSDRKEAKCDQCPGELKGKPIKGITVITGMKKDGDEYSGGKILDPNSGKEYKCLLELDGKDKLNVRGYIGISLIGRTQTWQRVN